MGPLEGREGMLETTLEAVVTSDLFDATDWRNRSQKRFKKLCFVALMNEPRKGKRPVVEEPPASGGFCECPPLEGVDWPDTQD